MGFISAIGDLLPIALCGLTSMTAGAVLAISYLPAAAHDDGSFDARQARQAKAIERGRVKGKITWREGRQLRRQPFWNLTAISTLFLLEVIKYLASPKAVRKIRECAGARERCS